MRILSLILSLALLFLVACGGEEDRSHCYETYLLAWHASGEEVCLPPPDAGLAMCMIGGRVEYPAAEHDFMQWAEQCEDGYVLCIYSEEMPGFEGRVDYNVSGGCQEYSQYEGPTDQWLPMDELRR